jgi:uncharacterized glyoxalase superfamily protein PhnB
MIEGSARLHSAPTKCHEPSDSTAHWGLRSCTAAKIRHSPAFEQGTSYLNLIGQPAERRWSWWGRLIFYVADVDALYDRALAAGFQPATVPHDAEWGERFFHLIDPDDHELSFARPLLPVSVQ